ncbi:MAG: ATP-grasp domain-containing protein [bacterium]
MKKVYVEIKNGIPINVDIQNAIDGFEYLGYEPIGFTKEDVYVGKLNLIALHNPVVGSIDGMKAIFRDIKKMPDNIDFPSFLFTGNFIDRDLTKMKLNDFIKKFKQNNEPKFIKPVLTKLFDGALISKLQHLNYLNNFDNPLVWVSDPIHIISEYRIYVHNNHMVYSSNYNGDFKVIPDYDYIETLIKNYQDAPVAYTIDVGILNNGKTTVIEFNDFWAIGSYGLYCMNYAEMLNDRYTEIINKKFYN